MRLFFSLSEYYIKFVVIISTCEMAEKVDNRQQSY